MYNSSSYILKCITSILDQSYKNLELILIDDGSSDNTLELCKRFKDKRLKIFEQSNSGASSARNRGLANCSGNWIIFVDSDDFISPNYIENLLGPTLLDNTVDFVLCGATIHNLESIRELYSIDTIQKIENTNLDELYTTHDLLNRGQPGSKLYKTDIIINNHIQFEPNARFGEDTIFLHNYLRFCNNVCVIGETGYHIVNNSYSVSKCLYDIKYELATLKHFSNILTWHLAHLKNEKAKNLLKKKKMLYLTRVLLSLWKYPHSDKEKLSILKAIDYSNIILYNGGVAQRIGVGMLKCGQFKIFITLLNLYYSLKQFTDKCNKK